MNIRTDDNLIGDLRDEAIRQLGLTNWARWTMFSHDEQNRIVAKQLEIARMIFPNFAARFENRGGTYYDRISGTPIIPKFLFYREVDSGEILNQPKFVFPE